MKKRFFFLLHLPPPVHGSSLVGKTIREGKSINDIFDCFYINLLTSQNISETGKISLKKILRFTFTLVKLLYLLVTNRPQLCYLALTVTGTAFYKDVLLVALLKIFGIKRVYHLHNKGISLHRENPINRLCYHFVFKDAQVILLSKYLYYDIKLFVSEEKVHICPNGIRDERQKAVESCSEVNNTVKILFLSNFIESKGVLVLLEACEILKKKKIPFECIFIGEEGDLKVLQFHQKVKQLDLEKQVSYSGVQYGMGKNKILSEVNLFVLPTYNDCFPLILLEAMSYSLPIVSTYEGGIPDIVEDGVTGFLVPQKDTNTLAEKLEILIKNPLLRQQMGRAGRLKYERQFTLEIFEKRLVDILQLILSPDVQS